MRRYYWGDIEGKFWFGVQSSTSAERFGKPLMEEDIDDDEDGSTYTDTWFEFFTEDLPEVVAELNNIVTTMGPVYPRLHQFIRQYDNWTDQNILDSELITPEEFQTHIANYADLVLGRKIHKSIKNLGQCIFSVEL